MASVVGLSHLFRTVADSNSARLKTLAVFLRKSCRKANGWLEIVLRRNSSVPADKNAVSVLIPNPDQTSEGGKSYIAWEFFLIHVFWIPHSSYDFQI